MREMIVSGDEQGQRLDKFLRRRLPLAPSSFLYRMLRKKNITLQGKKADGSEKVQEGDVVSLFLSDETVGKFSAPRPGEEETEKLRAWEQAYRALTPLVGENPVLYEDRNILIVKKPPGILSQKASESDLSMNEWLRGYLLFEYKYKMSALTEKSSGTGGRAEGFAPQRKPSSYGNATSDYTTHDNVRQTAGTKARAEGFEPSVCNRLDRNTGGILLCAKTLQGSRALSLLIRERRIAKTYQMLVHGEVTEPGEVRGELIKDEKTNHVRAAGASPQDGAKARQAATAYRPVKAGKHVSLVEADLITGRSHQLRVHMASIGHPILFDPRYGDKTLDRAVCGRPKSGQLLWCTRVTFPSEDECEEMRGVLAPVAGKSFSCPFPGRWMRYLRE